MDTQIIQTSAGTLASSIYMASTFVMLFRVWRTKDVTSFSAGWIALSNIGNLIYWLYVLSLPIGPIYILHGFYTVSSVILACWYLLYRQQSTTDEMTIAYTNLRETSEFPALYLNHQITSNNHE